MNSFITLSRSGNEPAADFEISGFGSDDPFAATRRLAYAGEDGTAAGLVTFKGRRYLDSFPHWELIIVTAGELVFDLDLSSVTVPAGGAVVVNRGARVRISAEETASWVFCAATAGKDITSEPATINLIDRTAELFASPSPLPEALLTPNPSCRSHEFFNQTAIGFSAGMWDSTPYARKVMPHKSHELMHLTQGRMTLTDGAGRAESYAAGDTVFVPFGAQVSWKSEEHVAKIYCSRVVAA
jgi:uncharacterized cupin superfamily protein